MTTTNLTAQSPTLEVWTAVAQQPGFEGLHGACPGYKVDGPHGLFHLVCLTIIRTQEYRHIPKTNCACQGWGWTVNKDRDALEKAVLEKGWLMRQAQEPEGDAVWIVDSKRHDVGQMVSMFTGLRGGDAEIVAVARALGILPPAEETP
jgi:hypothetical protein